MDACQAHPYMHFIELRVLELHNKRAEFIIVDAGDGTVAANNPAGIRRKERLAIEINPHLPFPFLSIHSAKAFRYCRISMLLWKASPERFVFTIQAGVRSSGVGHLSASSREFSGG